MIACQATRQGSLRRWLSFGLSKLSHNRIAVFERKGGTLIQRNFSSSPLYITIMSAPADAAAAASAVEDVKLHLDEVTGEMISKSYVCDRLCVDDLNQDSW